MNLYGNQYNNLQNVNEKNTTLSNSFHEDYMNTLDIGHQTKIYDGGPYNVNIPKNGGYAQKLNNAEHGMEYNWEIPNDRVISSPGGTASNFHHWTGGFYGQGGSSQDKYGFQNPRYVYGDYGNMYNVGETSSQNLGYYPPNSDPKYYKNQEPPRFTHPTNYSKVGKENFSINNNDDYDIIDNGNNTLPKNTLVATTHGEKCTVKMNINPTTFLVLLVLAFFAMFAWTNAGVLFFRQKINKGRKITYSQMFLFSLVLSFLFVAGAWWSNSYDFTVEN